jgi:hypothetical protein
VTFYPVAEPVDFLQSPTHHSLIDRTQSSRRFVSEASKTDTIVSNAIAIKYSAIGHASFPVQRKSAAAMNGARPPESGAAS